MRTLMLALALATQITPAEAARVAPAAAPADRRLVIAGVPMHHTAANYHKYIKFLTVSARNQKHPAFSGTNTRAIQGLECPLRRQIYRAMNWNRAERFAFASLRHARENFSMRVNAVAFMFRMGPGRLHDVDFGYAGRTVPPAADRAHWVKLAGWSYASKKGAGAAASIDGIVRDKFRGECLGAMQINVLHAARLAIGARRFDRIHANGLAVGGKGTSSQAHAKAAASNSPDDMVPGDWVYLQNKPDYNTDMRPGGKLNYWKGENAVYLGRLEVGPGGVPTFGAGATRRFSGMGAYALSEAELRGQLKKHYLSDMRPPFTYHAHAITDADVRWVGTQRLVTGG